MMLIDNWYRHAPYSLLMLCLFAGCREATLVEPTPLAFESVPTGGALFTKRINGYSWGIDWMNASGGERRTVIGASHLLMGLPYAGRVPVVKSDTSDDHSVDDSMFVFDLNSGSKTFITTNEKFLYHSMELSRDGESALIWSEQDAETHRAAVCVTRSNRSATLLLVEFGVWSPPAFSPDGRSVAFVQERFATDNFDLFVINTDGTGQRMIDSNVALGRPSWSPDGMQIAYQKSGIWITNIHGGVAARISPDGAADSDATWSPDGSSIVCVSVLSTGDKRIVVMNTDGTNRRELANSTGTLDHAPVWSATGRELLYLSTDRDGSQLYSDLIVLNIVTGQTSTLANDASGRAVWY